MGQFSWKFADQKNRSALKIYEKAYVACPDGSLIYEGSYGGYGMFGMYDIYELVAEWNKNDISEENIEKPRQCFVESQIENMRYYQNAMKRYQFQCKRLLDFIHGKSEEEMEERYGDDWKRNIGIDIACSNEKNAALKYPIKICKAIPDSYECLPASKLDPEQGR